MLVPDRPNAILEISCDCRRAAGETPNRDRRCCKRDIKSDLPEVERLACVEGWEEEVAREDVRDKEVAEEDMKKREEDRRQHEIEIWDRSEGWDQMRCHGAGRYGPWAHRW